MSKFFLLHQLSSLLQIILELLVDKISRHVQCCAVLRIRIWIHRIHMFLDLQDPDLLVK